MNARSPIVSEFDSDEQAQSYEEWLKIKVETSLADCRPFVPHDEVMSRAKAILEAKGKRSRAC